MQNVNLISPARILEECNGVGSRTSAAKSALYLRIMCEESKIIQKESLQSPGSKAFYHSELPSQNKRSCGGMGAPSPGNKSWEKAEFFELSRGKRIYQLGRRVKPHLFLKIRKLPSNSGPDQESR